MGGWLEGNEGGIHRPYGIMDPSLMNGVQQLRDLYGGPIRLTSGYRCPRGNLAAGSKYPQTSRHMRGTAIDISSGGDRDLFDDLYGLAFNLNLNPLPWETYPHTRHLHIGW